MITTQKKKRDFLPFPFDSTQVNKKFACFILAAFKQPILTESSFLFLCSSSCLDNAAISSFNSRI